MDIRGCFRAGAVRVSIDFTEGRLANKNDSRNPWTNKDMLQEFIDLNNRVIDRFSAEERVNIGIHTCPGGDCDSVHSKEVPYEKLLSKMFQLNAGYFLIQCASEEDRESVYRMCGEYSREDANGVPQLCFMGVVNPLNPDVETPEGIRDELLLASKYIPVERLGATDDCGFSPFSRDVKPEQRKPRRISIGVGDTPARSTRGSRPRRWGARLRLAPRRPKALAGAASVAAPVFSIRTRDPGSYARTGTLHLAHGEVRTPAFVPLATKAVVKTLEVREAADLGFDMVLGNTFHLFLSPGHELIEKLGGLHRFQRWDRPIITDSGGFQVFSMGHGTVADEIKGRAALPRRKAPRGIPVDEAARHQLRLVAGERAGAILSIEEEGVRFRSYLDGSEQFMGPETSMAVQAALRSDIALVFDECTPFHADRDYTARSTERTHRWLDRCLAWHAEHGPEGQVLYGIVQGGTEEDLRRASAQEIAARPVAGSRSAARWARTRRRCSRSSSGRSRNCRRTGRATCSGSAKSTIWCAASSSGSTPSTARCRPGSAATAWRSCPTRSAAGASIWPRLAGRRPTSRSSRAVPARPAPRATRARTSTTCCARKS